MFETRVRESRPNRWNGTGYIEQCSMLQCKPCLRMSTTVVRVKYCAAACLVGRTCMRSATTSPLCCAAPSYLVHVFVRHLACADHDVLLNARQARADTASIPISSSKGDSRIARKALAWVVLRTAAEISYGNARVISMVQDLRRVTRGWEFGCK